MKDTNRNEKDRNTCDNPETRSISEKVHKHLQDKNDHITDEDIRNAKIDPNANELEDLHSNETSEKTSTEPEDKQAGKDQITPWDLVDKNATE